MREEQSRIKMQNRVAKGKSTFGRLKKIWSSQQYGKKVKIKM